MSKGILILGESGSGKSSSIRTLPAEETFIINVIGKTLPFKGSQKLYTQVSPENPKGNCYQNDNMSQVAKAIRKINNERPEIKYLIIDDAGYLIMNEFMRRSLEKGYDKFSALGKSFSDIIEQVTNLRDDLFCFVIMHVEQDINGKTKPKTVGKVIDQYVCIEGKFTYVFHAIVYDGQYKFITNHDGLHMAKTPMDCFDQPYIDNDLLLVTQRITEYLEG